MLNHHIQNINISAHHGYIDRENRLDECIYLSETNPDIDMFEIDFVTINNVVMSAHDYDDLSILRGSFLSDWLNYFIPKRKIIWIDLKDTLESLITCYQSRFDPKIFFDTLAVEREKFKQKGIELQDFLIVSSQFPHVQQMIQSYQSDYLIINDFPSIATYALRDFVPSFLKDSANHLVNKLINTDISNLDQSAIIALDTSFFSTVEILIEFIRKLNQKIIIIYSLKYDDDFDLNIGDKKIISQYDYFYPIDQLEITSDLFPKN